MESDINGMKNQMQLPIKDKFEIKNFNREITAMWYNFIFLQWIFFLDLYEWIESNDKFHTHNMKWNEMK